ncbi:MAG: beta strand repeat-containing protein [Spirochaetota bacterium]
MKIKKSFLLLQFAILMAFTGAACKGSNSNPEDGSGGFSGSPAGDTTQPAISSVAPANNETDVFLNPTLRVTFNKGMNATTLTTLTTGSACNTAIQLSADNFATCIPMSGQPTIEGSATYRITPAANLAASTVHKLKVTTDAKDSQGRAISADYETTFTTGTSSDVAGTCDTIEDIRTIGATLDLNTSNTRTTIGSGAGTTCTLGQSTVTMVNRDGSSMGFYIQRSKSSAAIYVFTGSVDPTATLNILPGDRITINAGVWANLCVTHFRKTLQISKYTDSTCTTTSSFVAGDFAEGTANNNYLADIGTEITTARALELADESRLFTMSLTANLTAEDGSFAFTGVYGAASTSFRLRKSALVNSLLAINTTVNLARAVPGRNNDVWEFNTFGSGAGGTTNYDGVTTGGGTNGHALKSIGYTSGPTITLYNPAQGANYGNTGTTFEVTFNQSMNVSTVNTTNLKVVAGNDCTAAALTATGVVASNQDKTFTLTLNGGQLTAGNQYTTCVSTNVQNSSNLNLGTAGAATWTAIIPPVYQFSALNSGDALPSGMTVRCQAAGDSTSTTSAMTGTYSGTTSVADTSFGVRGLGTDGISVLNTGSANAICATGFIAAVDTAFSTVGKTGITVSFKAGQYSDQTREWGWRLQLSTDGGTNFSDVTNTVDFDSAKAGTTVYSTQMYTFGPYRLPVGAENNANVVLRWRYYTVSGSSGNRTRLILDDILVQDSAAVDSTAPTVGTLAGTGSGTQIPLSWASGSDNTTPTANLVYRVYEHGSSFTPPGTGTLLYTTLPGQTSYTRTGLSNSTAYFYRILAVDAQGNLSSASNEITYTTPAGAFNVTATVSASNTSATVTFSEAPTAGAGASGAENTANYSIIAGAGNCGDASVLAVSAASLAGSVVTLTTAAQTGGTSYKICVSNVTRNSDSVTLTTNNGTFNGTGSGVSIYSFSDWTANATAGVFPTGMTFGCTPTLDPTLGATVSGSYTGATNVAATSFGVRGEGTSGISILNTGTANAICNHGAGNGFMASIDVPINTTGRTNIQVSWKGAQVSDQTREYGLRLQYDCGSGYTDVTGPVEFSSVTAGTSTAFTSFGPTTLPAACENNATAKLRWRYYSISGSAGSRTRIILDDVSVTGN